MQLFATVWLAIISFFETGGPVLYGILFVTILMWTLIVERIWFFGRILPRRVAAAQQEWDARADTTSWYAHRIRDQLLSELSVEARQFIPVIETLMQILPLLGLLGTVWGMIQVFDIMTVFGTGNARLMAGGVSQATIPTMAGLVAALSGFYFSAWLRGRLERKIDEVRDLLVHH